MCVRARMCTTKTTERASIAVTSLWQDKRERNYSLVYPYINPHTQKMLTHRGKLPADHLYLTLFYTNLQQSAVCTYKDIFIHAVFFPQYVHQLLILMYI